MLATKQSKLDYMFGLFKKLYENSGRYLYEPGTLYFDTIWLPSFEVDRWRYRIIGDMLRIDRRLRLYVELLCRGNVFGYEYKTRSYTIHVLALDQEYFLLDLSEMRDTYWFPPHDNLFFVVNCNRAFSLISLIEDLPRTDIYLALGLYEHILTNR